jgi:hypothetical protein
VHQRGDASKDIHLSEPDLHQIWPDGADRREEAGKEERIVCSARRQFVDGGTGCHQPIPIRPARSQGNVRIDAQLLQTGSEVRQLPLGASPVHRRNTVQDSHPTAISRRKT